MSDIRPHVLKLQDLGFDLLPLVPGMKVPAVTDWQNLNYGFGTFAPGDNVGIHTSIFESRSAEPRYLLAVDIDVKNGVNGFDTIAGEQAAGRTFPKTYTQFTPTGGQHWVYWAKEPVKNGVNVLGPGVDIRGKGGYIVGAGSSVPAGSYTHNGLPVAEAPAWLVERCGTRREREKKPQVSTIEVDQEAAQARAEKYLANRLPDMEPGRNDAGFRVACKLKDLGLNRGRTQATMAEQWQCEPPLEDDELEHVVRSAFTYGTETPGCDSFEAHFPGVATTEASEPVEGPDAERPPQRFTLIDFADISIESTAEPLVEAWLNKGGLTVVYGASGAGKSFWVLDLCLHVALSKEWNGKKVYGGPVIYLATENPQSIKARMLAQRKHHKLNDVRGKLFLVQDPLNFVSGPEDATALAAALKGVSPAPVLIVIDTAAMAMPGADENSAKDVGIFVQRAKKLQALTGAHVLLVHHAGKNVSNGARGSSSLKAAVDVEIEVRSKSARVTKQRDGAGGQSVHFEIQDIRVGGFGREVQCGVLVPAAAAKEPTVVPEEKKGPPKLPARAVRLLGVLEDLLANEEEPDDGEASVAIKELRKAFCVTLEGEVQPRSMETTFARELGKLKDRQYITVKEGRVSKRALVTKEAKAA